MECVVCGEHVGEHRVSCGLHPSHVYCVPCTFQRWFLLILSEIDHDQTLLSTTSFMSFLTQHNVSLLGQGPYLGTLAHDSCITCDFEKMPLKCWRSADMVVVEKPQLWLMFLELVRQRQLPPDPAFVDHCLAFYHRLYCINESSHSDNLETLRTLIIEKQLCDKRLEQLNETHQLLHGCLQKLKIHTAQCLLRRDTQSLAQWDQLVDHLLMLSNGHIDSSLFDSFLATFEASLVA